MRRSTWTSGSTGQRGVHAREQIVEAGAGDSGSENFIFVAAVGFHERGELFGRQAIGLVEHLQARTILHAEVGEDFQHIGILFGVMRIGNVAHLHDQRGFLHLFQSGAESSDQIRRQIAQEIRPYPRAARGAAKAGARRAPWDRASRTFSKK